MYVDFRPLTDKRSRYGTFFGSISVDVTLDTPLPDTQGLYAATENGKLSLVIINKNPDTPIAFTFQNVPPANYFMRHFGGQAGVAKWQVSNVPHSFEVFASERAFSDNDIGVQHRIHRCSCIHCRVFAATVNAIVSTLMSILACPGNHVRLVRKSANRRSTSIVNIFIMS